MRPDYYKIEILQVQAQKVTYLQFTKINTIYVYIYFKQVWIYVSFIINSTITLFFYYDSINIIIIPLKFKIRKKAKIYK